MTTTRYLPGEDYLDLRDLLDAYTDMEGDEAEDDTRRDIADLFKQITGSDDPDDWTDTDEPTLIRDSYFEEYAQDLAEDLGAISTEYQWPQSYIDWERAARDLQMDYTPVTYAGVTYWMQ